MNKSSLRNKYSFFWRYRMEFKTQLPDSFVKEKKDEKEWESLIAPTKTLLKILEVLKAVFIILGILMCILFGALSNGAAAIVLNIISTALSFGGLVLLCYIGQLICYARINHLSVEYQQRNLLKEMAGEEKKTAEAENIVVSETISEIDVEQ